MSGRRSSFNPNDSSSTGGGRKGNLKSNSSADSSVFSFSPFDAWFRKERRKEGRSPPREIDLGFVASEESEAGGEPPRKIRRGEAIEGGGGGEASVSTRPVVLPPMKPAVDFGVGSLGSLGSLGSSGSNREGFSGMMMITAIRGPRRRKEQSFRMMEINQTTTFDMDEDGCEVKKLAFL